MRPNFQPALLLVSSELGNLVVSKASSSGPEKILPFVLQHFGSTESPVQSAPFDAIV